MLTEQGYSVGCSLKSVKNVTAISSHKIETLFLSLSVVKETRHTHIVVQLHCLVRCRAVLILGRVLANPEMNIPS